MTYIPSRTIVNTRGVLTESSDMSVSLSTLATKESYLVVTENLVHHVLDLGQILLFERNLSLTDPISTVFTTRLNDAFVARYLRTDIPILNDHRVYGKRIKVFNPLEYKGHTVQFTSVNTPDIVDDVSKRGFLDDLVISTKQDMRNYLVAVNGVFHKTALSGNKLYVLDGFRTLRLSEFKDITVVDTSPLGGHEIIPLTNLNVALSTYNGEATITLPASAKDKTVFLVIDGYFYHTESRVMTYSDDTHLKLSVNKLPLIDQFRHNPRTLYKRDRYGEDASQRSRKYTDAFDALFLGKRAIPASALTSLEFQYSRLTHYHSFLVVVDNPNVFSMTYDILPTGTPRFFRDHADRLLSGMMQYAVGLCPSYLILRDPHQRKSIYIQSQTYDMNLQRDMVNPEFIPSLVPDIAESVSNPPRLIDYVCA